MSKRYTTHNVYLESADFYVLVIEFPDEDINDKLSLLAAEKGLIYQSFYEDFVIGTCMANAGPFFYHIRKRPELMMKFASIRKEALSLIFEHSPGFKPENIVINQNNILKTKGTVKEDEAVRPLTENDLWDQEPPLSNFGPATITDAPRKDDNPFLDDDEDGMLMEDAGVGSDNDENPFADSGGGPDIPYELVRHKWDKIGLFVVVRKYEESEDALISLLGGTPFETTPGYHLLIVERCIEDFADVFQLLDQMGVSSKISPENLVEELYNIAISYNPFLKLDNVDLSSIRKEYQARRKSDMMNNKQMSAAGKRKYATASKKRFSDVPRETLLNLDAAMKKKIVGQDEAVETIADAIQRASVGLKRSHEPLGSFLFTGNTGVGKTETAKALAECLGANLVRIDCQEYQMPHEATKLTGSPPGYVGYEDGGHLAKDVAKHPFSVVLFDEIEKAHSSFHERVLQIIDDGVITDNKGNKVSFDNCVLIMTSNIGVKEVDSLNRAVGFGDVHSSDEAKTAKAREQALKKKFKPEFLNRIDEIVHFRKLDKSDYLHILEILLEEVHSQIETSKNVHLNFNAGAKNFLLDKGIDRKFGARPMRRAIKKYLNTPLARAILRDEILAHSKVNVNLKPERDGLTFRTVKRSPAKEEENGE